MRKEEMVRVSSDYGISNSPKKAGLSRRKNAQKDNDKHWDFLDEIEAPLWIDLTLECQSGYDDKDDKWFRVNHPFHQCSSRQLISAFAHSVEGHLKLNILEQSSTELPPLVSKSRGKEYTSRDRRQGNQMVTSNNQHVIKSLKKKSSFVSSGSARMTGSRSSKGKNNESGGSDSDSRYQKILTETARQHDIGTIPPLDDWKFTSNSNFFGKEESVSSSTITSEGSGQPQQNSLEVSSNVLGQTGGFLSDLKISLRKSCCVTRQASRVEIINGRLSESQRFSSGKSSIGSSSSHGYEKKILTERNQKDVTPCNGDVRMHVSLHQKVHEANLFGAPGVQLAKPKLRSQSFKATSINQGNAKVKVAHVVNRKCPHTAAVKAKEKVVVKGSGRNPAGAKENLAGNLASSHKLSTRNTMQVQKVTTKYPEKSKRMTSVFSKERINERSKGKKIETMAEKVYFR